MYTKTIQNTKFIYILYTKIVQIKICMIMNVQKSYIAFTQKINIYKKCTKCTKLVQSLDQKRLQT